MKHNILFIISILTLHFGYAQEVAMNEKERTDFRKNVASETQKIKTLSTDFVQYKHMDFLSKDIETSGKMAFQAPDKLNWQYTKPYQYRIVFKDKKVLIDDQGKKSSIDAGGKVFENINTLIVGSVSGDMFDEKQFDIQYFKTKTHDIAKLAPKTNPMKKYVEQVTLYFPKGDANLSEVKLTEPSGDYTRIIFKNRKINTSLNDSDFSI